MAFSSISQAGYLMLGVIAGSAQGMSALVYYVLVYLFSNLGVFGVISIIEQRSGKVRMEDYRFIADQSPFEHRHDAVFVFLGGNSSFCRLFQ